MTDPRIIIEIVESLSTIKYMKKGMQDLIQDNLKTVQKYTDECEDRKINKIIEYVSYANHNSDDRKSIEKLIAPVINIIKKYEKHYVQDPRLNKNITGDLTVDMVERTIDSKISAYTKYNKYNPMKGISWNRSKSKYQITYKTINMTAKCLDTACEIIKRYHNNNRFIYNDTKIYFLYQKYYFVCYLCNNRPCFDIRHCIAMLNLKTTSQNDKYNEHRKDIIYYKWHKNQYGGYILRELVDENTMYEIILSSNSDFTQLVKIDIPAILKQLCTAGQNKTNKFELNDTNQDKITNLLSLQDAMELSKQPTPKLELRIPLVRYYECIEISKLMKNIRDESMLAYFQSLLDLGTSRFELINEEHNDILCKLQIDAEMSLVENNFIINKDRKTDIALNSKRKYVPYTYTSEEDLMHIEYLFEYSQMLCYDRFDGRKVLYAVLIPLITKHNNIIIKFGYTDNLPRRMYELTTEYKCQVYFLDARIIYERFYEHIFHKMLRDKYSYLIEEYNIEGTDKIELYKYNPILMHEYELFTTEQNMKKIQKQWDICIDQLSKKLNNEQDRKVHEPMILDKMYEPVCDAKILKQLDNERILREKELENARLIKEKELDNERLIQMKKMELEHAKLMREIEMEHELALTKNAGN